MAFKQKKKFGVQPVGRPASDINVTPLVDVMLVLLIIFMVVTPLLEKDIEVRVPDNEQQDTTDEPDTSQLVVSLDKAGILKINNQQIAWNDYVTRLHKMLNAKPDDHTVFFTADDGTNYAAVVKALDGARTAGANPLGMVTEPIPQAAAAAPGAPGAPAPGAAAPAPAPTTP